MTEFVTRREFARLEGCDEKQVRRALSRGLLTADSEGKLNSSQVGSGWRKPRVDSKDPLTPLRRVVRTSTGEDINNVRTDVRANVLSVRSDVRTPAAPDEMPNAPMRPAPEASGLRRAIAHKEDFAGRLKELEYRQKAGELIELALARRILFEEARAARDAWLNWPNRYAALMAAELGVEQADRVAEVLSLYVHKQISALGEPSGEFKKRA